MGLPLFLAKRIFRSNDNDAKISVPAVRIATAGVAIGLAVMIIAVCVVIGFQHAVRDKVIGFGSHITVNNYMNIEMGEHYPISADAGLMNNLRSIGGVSHVQKFANKQGILKTDTDFLGVTLKGIDENYDTTFIGQYVIDGALPKFSSAASGNKIVISKTIADKLKLSTGDKVFAYFVGAGSDVRTRRFTIAAIYDTNLKPFDEALCFTDFYTTLRLNNWEEDQVSGIEMAVENVDELDNVASVVEKLIDHKIDKYGHTYLSTTITKTYPNIFAWLKLLDLNIWVILALMVAVASFTMISGLLIIILERTNMIGTLKSLGTHNATIRKTFLWLAVFIIGRGLIIGNILGLAICFIQQMTGIVQLDAARYYVSTAPVEINLLYILALNLATLLLCTIILIAPSYLISKIDPAKSIRFE